MSIILLIFCVFVNFTYSSESIFQSPNISFLYPITSWDGSYGAKYSSNFKNKCRILTECTDDCKPKRNGDICELKIDFKCPIGCQYSPILGECNGVLCNPDHINKECPIDCDYDPQYKLCIPRSDNVCEKTKIEKCDGYFLPNSGGTLCIHEMCDKQCHFCPQYCKFDRDLNKCIGHICETMVKASCPHRYILEGDEVPQCNDRTMINLCKNADDTYLYPLAKKDIYGILKCIRIN